MKKIIIGLLLFVSCFVLKSQTVIDVTIDTIYFFIYKNDTVILEPTEVTPGMSVITNYNAVGAQMYLGDTFQGCIDHIEKCHLQCSQHSQQGQVYIKKEDETLYALIK
jgi:hypothetical protein